MFFRSVHPKDRMRQTELESSASATLQRQYLKEDLDSVQSKLPLILLASQLAIRQTAG